MLPQKNQIYFDKTVTIETSDVIDDVERSVFRHFAYKAPFTIAPNNRITRLIDECANLRINMLDTQSYLESQKGKNVVFPDSHKELIDLELRIKAAVEARKDVNGQNFKFGSIDWNCVQMNDYNFEKVEYFWVYFHSKSKISSFSKDEDELKKSEWDTQNDESVHGELLKFAIKKINEDQKKANDGDELFDRRWDGDWKKLFNYTLALKSKT
jgi:hypothetical protein